MDGFEIAPATASKLNKYRFTPSPEKQTVPLPDVSDGTIDLTSPVKVSTAPGAQTMDSSRPGLPKGQSSSDEKLDVFSSSTSASKDTTTTIQAVEDSDKTMVMIADVDEAEKLKEKPEEEEKPKEEEKPLSAEQQKVLDMVMQG